MVQDVTRKNTPSPAKRCRPTGWPNTSRPLRLAVTFKTPESICMTLAHFSEGLFWTHLFTLTSSNLQQQLVPPGESSHPDFVLRRLLRWFQHKMLNNEQNRVAEETRRQQCIERRQDRGRPRSPWTVANFVLVMAALCSRGPLYFCPVVSFYPLSIFYLLLFFSSPNLSGRRLDVYHTSTHGVALVRI